MSTCSYSDINVTNSIRSSFRLFFSKPLRKRTNKALRALFMSHCVEHICISVEHDGIHRTYVDHVHSLFPKISNAGTVVIHFVRDHVSIYTNLTHAEAHPLLSNAFYGHCEIESMTRGTIYNLSTQMEQSSPIFYIMDVPCDAFFVADWFPEITESLRDVIQKICHVHNERLISLEPMHV
jgi:hypothetical protein